MAGPLPGTSDRRPAHHSPDPEMAQGGCPGRWGRDGERGRNGAGIGGFAVACQYLPVLRPRPLCRALATARGIGRRDHRAVRRWFYHRLSTITRRCGGGGFISWKRDVSYWPDADDL